MRKLRNESLYVKEFQFYLIFTLSICFLVVIASVCIICRVMRQTESLVQDINRRGEKSFGKQLELPADFKPGNLQQLRT